VLLVLSFIALSYAQCATSAYTIVPSVHNKMNATNKIRLGVMGSYFGTWWQFPSAVMRATADMINNRTDILADTQIELIFAPSPDTSSSLVSTMFVIQNLNVTGLIGGISTTESRVMQLAAKIYNVPQISTHAVGAVMSNKDEYPYFLRTEPSDAIQINAIVAIFKELKWKKGVILYSDNDYGAGFTSLVLAGQLEGVEFIGFSIASFANNTGDLAAQMDLVKRETDSKGYRIFVLYLTAQSTNFVMQLANERGMVGNDYEYVLSTNSAGIYTQALVPDVLPYLKGSISIALPNPAGPEYDYYFSAYQTLLQQNVGRTFGSGSGTRPYYFPYSPAFQFFFVVVDPILAYAYAYDALLQKMPFNQITGPKLLAQLINTTYEGTSGHVQFDKNGDRIGFYAITNLLPFNGTYKSFVVGLYSMASNSVNTTVPFTFFDGSTTVPADGPTFYHEFSVPLSGGLGALVGVGVVVSVFALIVLMMYWQEFTQKFGAFYCLVLIFGSLLGYAAALVNLPRPEDELCVAFPWLLGCAFTLVYGCLFIKTWMLYRLWRHAMQLKRMSVTPLTVIKYVGAALSVEVIFLIIWTVVDPPKLKAIEMVDDTFQMQCKSDSEAWWIVFIVIKGVWLLFGATITVLTRSVVKEFNHFSVVVYAIYNNMILIVIAIPLAVLLEEVPDGVKIISTIVIVLAFMFTTIILFFETWLNVLFPDSKLPISLMLASRKGNSASSTQASNSRTSTHSATSHSST
jgi:ABC-type branched-subunit amino acid transport system substrate-binding protein